MLVMLIDGIQCGKVVHKARVGSDFLIHILQCRKNELNPIVSFLESLIEFDFLDFRNGDPKYLEQLAFKLLYVLTSSD